MNGDTPKKPVEGDWPIETHEDTVKQDAAPAPTQEPEQTAQPPDISDDSQPVSADVVQPDVAQVPPEQATAPRQDVDPAASTSRQSAPPASGWTTSIGDSMWEIADAEIASDIAGGMPVPESPSIQWTASEFIAHDKSMMWYAGLAGVGIVITLFSYFIVHDIIASIAVIFIVILFGFVAAHKPRTLPYRIDSAGITIGDKLYQYGQFKSFGIVQEGAFSSITLMPLKRFGQPLSIYYPPEEEEKIVQVLANYMPAAQVKLDFIDKMLKSIHL